MSDTKNYLIGLATFAVGLIFITSVLALFIHRSYQGDIENTKRTRARYEMCSTIADPAARTLCSLDIKTGY